MKFVPARFMERFSAVWTSIEALGSVNFWAQIILAGFVLGTFFFTAVSVIATWRRDGLQRQRDLVREEQVAATSQLAADANERAANLEVAAESARSEQARLQLQIEGQRGENLRLQSQVELERTERLKLQQRVLPRRLSVEQREALRTALEREPAKGMVTMGIFLGTDDGIGFADDLMDAIGSSNGWHASGRGQFAMGGNVSGLAIVVKDRQRTPLRALSLQRALDAAGLRVPIGDEPQTRLPLLSEDEVFLFIAPKP